MYVCERKIFPTMKKWGKKWKGGEVESVLGYEEKMGREEEEDMV